MKKIIKIIIICLITLFSFYYTDNIINLANSKDPLMKEIKETKIKVEVVNGILKNNTMLVGSSGKKIDIEKSYQKMRIAKTFNKELLEYLNIKPEISKENNLEKLLIGKNTKEKEISLIFRIEDIDILKQIVYVLNNNSVKATFFINTNLLEKNLTEINEILDEHSLGIINDSNFNYIKNIVSKNSYDYANYCLYQDDEFLITCKLNNMNTIKPIEIKSNLYNYIKKNKKNGYIYEISLNNNNIKQLNSTIIYLKQKGYKILTINQLLKE